MAIKNSKFDSERFVSLFEMWGRKNPSYEKHYEDEEAFSEYYDDNSSANSMPLIYGVCQALVTLYVAYQLILYVDTLAFAP